MERVNVRKVLDDLGIAVRGETDTHYSVLCPFHKNTQTAAATISKKTGLIWCFNSNCAERVPLWRMVRQLKGWDFAQSLRYIERYATEDVSIQDVVTEIYADQDELPEFPLEELERLQEDFRESERARRYVAGRGISKFAARDFGLAYDKTHDMICTPMFDTNGNPVGLIRRTIEGKSFKNTYNLPTRKTLFNIHKAKRTGSETLILTESNFDAIRIHQTGFANVCATLGGTFSDYHVSQVYRSFDNIILMTDDDDAGRKFAKKIKEKAKQYGISVYRGRYDEYNLFPNGAKDVCDNRDGVLLVSERDIVRCIENASISL